MPTFPREPGYVYVPVQFSDGWHHIGVPIWFAIAAAMVLLIALAFVVVLFGAAAFGSRGKNRDGEATNHCEPASQGYRRGRNQGVTTTNHTNYTNEDKIRAADLRG